MFCIADCLWPLTVLQFSLDNNLLAIYNALFIGKHNLGIVCCICKVQDLEEMKWTSRSFKVVQNRNV